MAGEIATYLDNPAAEEAFAAYLMAHERGQSEEAETILRQNPGLAEEVAAFYAIRARVPKPWRPMSAGAEGRHLGDFELLHELGRGGEGVVYKARQQTLQRLAAVKVMNAERFSAEADMGRFRRVNTLLAGLQHANIVQIYYAGDSEMGPYVAMELLEGGSLKSKLADGWLPTPRQAAILVRDLARAMQYAHDRDIIHRDLKPANVLLQESGGDAFVPKIVDFGLAKKLDANETVTRTGAILGTASYMAPEQARGDHAEKPCDIYALGAILYELLTKRPPFVGATWMETLDKVREQEPTPLWYFNPEVPRDLETICLACLQKNPARRYASAAKLAADLDHYLNAEAIEWRPPGIVERVFRLVTRIRPTGSPKSWGWSLINGSITAGVGYLALAWGIATEQPDSVLYGILVAMTLVTTIAMWAMIRTRPWNTGDREGMTHVIAIMAAWLLLPLLYRPAEGMNDTAYRLSLVPLYAFLFSLTLFLQGALHWGGYFVIGIAYLVMAFLLKLMGPWSPLVFALFSASVTIGLGVFYLRLPKQHEVGR